MSKSDKTVARKRSTPASVRAISYTDEDIPTVVDDSFIKRGDRYDLNDDTVDSMAERARYLSRNNKGTPADKEYILKHTNKMLLRGFDKHTIAKLFDVSLQTIYNWCHMIDALKKRELTNFDRATLIHDANSFFQDTKALLMGEALKRDTTPAVRIRAIEAATRVEARRLDHFHAIGAFDEYRFNPKDSMLLDKRTESADKVHRILDDLLQGIETEIATGEAVKEGYEDAVTIEGHTLDGIDEDTTIL